MTELLRSEILPPSHSHFTRMLAVSIGCTVAGAVLGIVASTTSLTPALVTQAPGTLEEPVNVPIHVAAPRPVPEAAPSNEFLFVFKVQGVTYVKLADIEQENDQKPLPKHGTLKLVDDTDGAAMASIGVVEETDVPAAYRRFIGKQLLVENTCKANVVGFAVVSRLVGDTGYAGIEDSAWTATSVMSAGDTVLAARLDNCTGVYARDAALPKIVTMKPLANEDLEDAGRSALLASDAANEAQTDWAAASGEGHWRDHATIDALVVRHPTTRVTWIAVHASYSEMGCGEADVNVWGLYKVTDGALEAVTERKLEDLDKIEKIIDVDGDGTLELVGRPWLGFENVLARADGTAIDRLKLQFFGCPC